MDLDEIDWVPLDTSQLFLGRDVHDVASTVLTFDDLFPLDHLAHRDHRALDWEVLKRYQMLFTCDQSSDIANAIARDLRAFRQYTLLCVCLAF